MDSDRWWYDAWFVAIVGGTASSIIAAVLIAYATRGRQPHQKLEIKRLFVKVFWFVVAQVLIVFLFFVLVSHIAFPVKVALFAFAEVGLLAAVFFDVDVFDWFRD